MLLLVVDGGATHSRAILCDAALGLLAYANGPPASAAPRLDGASRGAEAGQALRAALTKLHRLLIGQTGAIRTPVEVVAGLAGTGRAAGRARARCALQASLAACDIPIKSLELLTDAHLALRAVAPTRGGPAAIVLAGTGSIALADDGHGRTHQTGGRGHYLSDEGGGFWFGAQLLAAVIRHADGRAPGAKAAAAAALAGIGLSDADALVETAPDLWRTPTRVASLAPIALTLASRGDPFAQSLVARAASALAELALTARQALAMSPTAPLGWAGSLLSPSLPTGGVHAYPPHDASSPAAVTASGDFAALPPAANPLPAALRSALPYPLAPIAGPLTTPPVVGAACSWLRRQCGSDAAQRLLDTLPTPPG